MESDVKNSRICLCSGCGADNDDPESEHHPNCPWHWDDLEEEDN